MKRPRIELLDVGGEGATPGAWNVNPSETRTLGPETGAPIPRRLAGRADAIPLDDRSVGKVVMARTPLTRAAVREMLRVVAPGGMLVLRHAVLPHGNPHDLVFDVLQQEDVYVENVTQNTFDLPTHQLLETQLTGVHGLAGRERAGPERADREWEHHDLGPRGEDDGE